MAILLNLVKHAYRCCRCSCSIQRAYRRYRRSCSLQLGIPMLPQNVVVPICELQIGIIHISLHYDAYINSSGRGLCHKVTFWRIYIDMISSLSYPSG